MRLLVTGTRYGRDDVREVLDAWVAQHGVPELVVLGDAGGVDKQALWWCAERDYRFLVRRAEWGKHGNAAGPRRNAAMVACCKPGDHCVAFPNQTGPSRGTENCVALARAAGLVVTVCRPNESVSMAKAGPSGVDSDGREVEP
jgi:hypothetical protein